MLTRDSDWYTVLFEELNVRRLKWIILILIHVVM